MIDAVLFDLFETLVTEYDPEWDRKPSLAARLGADPATFDRAWRATRADRLSGTALPYPELLQQVCRELGCHADTHVIRALSEERRIARTRLFERVDTHVLDALEALERLGPRLGLVSNCEPDEIEAWPDSELADHLEVAVFSCVEGLAKPDPAIYHLACERLGMAPERTLFVGDGAYDELAGAERAGLLPLWATWYLRQFPQWADRASFRPGAEAYPMLDRPDDLVNVVQRLRQLGQAQMAF